MRVFKEFLPEEKRPNISALTVGSFDGVHRGHQALLKQMKQSGPVCVVTFSNHPSHVLKSQAPTPLIFPPQLKCAWLEKYGVDILYLIEFSKAIASMSYETFLDQLLPFNKLVLGEGAALGKNREGTPENLRTFGKQRGFEVQYLPKIASGSETISSGRIRNLLMAGKIKAVSTLLGHPYQIEGELLKSGRLLLEEEICLPKDGDYEVQILGGKEPMHATLQIDSGKCFLPPLPAENVHLTFY